MLDALLLRLERMHGRYVWRRYWRDVSREVERAQQLRRQREQAAEHERSVCKQLGHHD